MKKIKEYVCKWCGVKKPTLSALYMHKVLAHRIYRKSTPMRMSRARRTNNGKISGTPENPSTITNKEDGGKLLSPPPNFHNPHKYRRLYASHHPDSLPPLRLRRRSPPARDSRTAGVVPLPSLRYAVQPSRRAKRFLTHYFPTT